MDRMGRRPSLALGLLFGAVGAALCIWGITAGSFLLFVGGMMLVGVAQAAVTLSRFVAAEVQAPERRGRAVSTVVLGGTVGAIGGPLLVKPAGHIAMQAGTGIWPALSVPRCSCSSRPARWWSRRSVPSR